MKVKNLPSFRFSGHESFPCRYAWLPKVFRAISEDESLFADEENAMVRLGVGKNMVRAIRFWMQVCGVAEPSPNGYRITEFGKALLGHRGLDPYLEDKRTLWILHWRISTAREPLFAWDFLINRWPHQEFCRSQILRAFTQEASRISKRLSSVTLEQHFDVFLRTYVPSRSRGADGQEDDLDCPLVELRFIRSVGERALQERAKREPLFAFRRETKDEITPELFVFCVDDFWRKQRGSERTVSFRDVALSHGSPGQVFKLPDWDIRQRLESLLSDSDGIYEYQETAMLQRIVRLKEEMPRERSLLSRIYATEDVNA